MFDFFRYMADEFSGIDTETAYKEKREREEREREIEKENRIIFSKKAKKIIIGLAVFYLLLTFATVVALKGFMTLPIVLFYIVKMMLAIGTIIALLIGKKKGETTALALIVAFFLIMFVSNGIAFTE